MRQTMRHSIHRTPSFQPHGFTLVETIVTMGVFIIIVSAAFTFLLQVYKAQSFTIDQTTATDEAKHGMNIMVKELREANLADTGAYAIESASAQSITFYSDSDTDASREKITYTVIGSDLTRTIIEVTGGQQPVYDEANAVSEVLSHYVTGVNIFSYYNGDHPLDMTNNPLGSPVDVSAIRLVHITLGVDPSATQAPQVLTIESDVQLRNFKDNLSD